VDDQRDLPRLSVEAFAAADLPEREVTLPSKGGCVLVRGFTKAIQQRLRREATRADGEMDNDRLELLLFAHGLVDPALTEEQAAHAFEVWDAGDVDAILQVVLEVNGLAPGNAREAAITFRD
jgi:hypothetical protein